MDESAQQAVAIVGVGAILPDAPDVSSFWKNLLGKRYSITEVPEGRWRITDYYNPDPSVPNKTYSKIGAWVRNYEFDWKRYHIPPKVVAAMDEGQQWALSVAAQALEDYGYPTRSLDTERTGVVFGTAMGGELHYVTSSRVAFPEFSRALESVEDFRQLPVPTRQKILQGWQAVLDHEMPPVTEDTMPGELPNIVSGRVANVLNLRGPNFITDAACAATFAAVQAAIDLLHRGQVDAVITGGVDRNMGASTFVKFSKIGALSATGTRPFGEGADGFVMGEGAAAFLLKRLDDAERDGDQVYAVIRGVGGASDGKGKGITAPNPRGQQLAIRRAWESAGLNPSSATLIEAHGTSTKVGDVTEVESLAAVFGEAKRASIALGSVKSNIGHLKAGAGAAGLLKAALAVHHRILPPTLNAQRPNPNLDFNSTPLYLNHEACEWSSTAGEPRRCGVSAYGFGGTNFHLVLEEHIPGRLTEKRRQFSGVSLDRPKAESLTDTKPAPSPASVNYGEPIVEKFSKNLQPFRGILALGAETNGALREKVLAFKERIRGGWEVPLTGPDPVALTAQERLLVDFSTGEELLDRLTKAYKAFSFDSLQAWRPLQAQGIFRAAGSPPGKIAFLFPGQGSQYLNMGCELRKISPVVEQVFAEADEVMTPILGKPLSAYIFPDAQVGLEQAEKELMQTAVTQPAMLTLDTALYRLLAEYGFQPDLVMGHSLGEYAALIAAGVMPFAEALEAAAARGREMTRVSVGDKGWMAAVMAPLEEVEAILKEVPGYVVAANVNSNSQCVIGGESQAVEHTIDVFVEKGYTAQRIPVSHAFHTKIVEPASGPLRQVLDRMHISPPKISLVANVTGEFYPETVEEIKDTLQQQIASPVQWVKGLQTLYAAGARTFVEVGPKKALKGFVDDVLGNYPDVLSLFTNHPKVGELPSFNQTLCGLYAAGYGKEVIDMPIEIKEADLTSPANQMVHDVNRNKPDLESGNLPAHQSPETFTLETVSQLLAQTLQNLNKSVPLGQVNGQSKPYDRNAAPLGSVVISGTGLGLPGAEKRVMDPENAMRILRGEQFVDLIPERFRKRMVAKRITRLIKSEDGGGRFEVIGEEEDVIRLAGRPGAFDLAEEYGVSPKLVEALDITSQLAMAAGLDALREAGIPLVQTYRRTTIGKLLPDRWMLPEGLRDETGVIFASAFPGGDRFANEFKRYFTWENQVSQVRMLEDLCAYTRDTDTLREIRRRIGELRAAMEHDPYEFDRRFLFRVLSMGHSQFAEFIGARGPNTQVNAACASTAQAIAIAEDWIRSGRCRRVIVIGADNVTGDNLIEWVGAGFLASGAAATDDQVEDAALPFDRRRHGTLMGMGACALVLESEDAIHERGMRGIVELLSSETNNSAFHGTRLDVEHIAKVMNNLVTSAERRFGLHRQVIASQLVFMSHETFTPARGGSASAEVGALRSTFGEAANEIVVSNTKGFTGHPMGVGVEDVIAVKILEHGIVPPVPNFKEIDPDLGPLNLSRGGRYPVQFALHLAAGFGSQIAMTLTRRIPGSLDRVDNRLVYQRWLVEMTGYDQVEMEVEKHVLRIKHDGPPQRPPASSTWQYGTGPMLRTKVGSDGSFFDGANFDRPARMQTAQHVAPQPVTQPGTASHLQADYNPPEAVKRQIQEVLPEKLDRLQADAPAQPSGNGHSKVKEEFQPKSGETIVPRVVEEVHVPVQELPQVDDIQEQVLKIVAEKTGYPREMLDLDLDMEADLGIDTVKQAETFAAIREAFGIQRQENLKLREYPTLAHVVRFVKDRSPEREKQAAADSVVHESKADQASEEDENKSLPDKNGHESDELLQKVLQIVSEKTGYPCDMLDPDLDMEADLGIDTVKQAETFLAIRQAFGISRDDQLRLRDYPTLGHVVQFVREKLAVHSVQHMESESAQEAVINSVHSPVQDEQPVNEHTKDEITQKVIEIVAQRSGYPPEMLEVDLDMEADLGIDTVKQAETFTAIRESFNIPRKEDLKLRDYPTLGHVIQFVKENRGIKDEQVVEVKEPDVEVVIESADNQAATFIPQAYAMENADRFQRRMPLPVLRPPIEFCKPTGVTLGEGSRVIVMSDEGHVSPTLADQLASLGATVLVLEKETNPEDIQAQVKAWMDAGPVQGVYWLPALDIEPCLEDMDLQAWRELNQRRVKNLYVTMRLLYDAVSEPRTFLVAATHLGGLHGYDDQGAIAPLGGAVTGFAKAYKRERPNALVKAVDFAIQHDSEAIAQALIAETVWDPGIVEAGYWREGRYAIALQEQALVSGELGMMLDEDAVFVVTGAAGGITSAIVTDLALASGATFYLLDMVALPEGNNAEIGLFRSDKEALKQKLIEDTKAAGKRPTPVVIEKRIMGIERQEAALRAVEAVKFAGGEAHYECVDLLDHDAVATVLDNIRQRHGKIDVLVHAAGVEISHALPEKEPKQFNLVFDVKAEGFYNLIHAAKGMPIGSVVAFSSVAGRFGNQGQTDYSAANDLLCKVISSMRAWRPETRAIAIDWTAWSGIGMATRGSIPKIMEMAGIEMLPPEVGVPTVRRVLSQNDLRGEILVAGKLGSLIEEWDETGGLDIEKSNQWLSGLTPPKVMVGKIKAFGLYGGLEVETVLDPQVQPFLHDHAMDGTPLLPGVMGTEAFAQLASLYAPGYLVAIIENEHFLRPFKFFRMQPQTLYLSATLQPVQEGELLAHTVLRSVTPPAKPGLPVQEKVHFTADVRLMRDLSQPIRMDIKLPSLEEMPIKAQSIYQVYFHGPAYQVLEAVKVDGAQAVGMIAAELPADTSPAKGAACVSPRLIESCLQTAGIWELTEKETLALPLSVDTITIYGIPDSEEKQRLYAVVEAIKTENEDDLQFNAFIIDESGTTYLKLEGYRTVALPGSVQIK